MAKKDNLYYLLDRIHKEVNIKIAQRGPYEASEGVYPAMGERKPGVGKKNCQRCQRLLLYRLFREVQNDTYLSPLKKSVSLVEIVTGEVGFVFT